MASTAPSISSAVSTATNLHGPSGAALAGFAAPSTPSTASSAQSPHTVSDGVIANTTGILEAAARISPAATTGIATTDITSSDDGAAGAPGAHTAQPAAAAQDADSTAASEAATAVAADKSLPARDACKAHADSAGALTTSEAGTQELTSAGNGIIHLPVLASAAPATAHTSDCRSDASAQQQTAAKMKNPDKTDADSAAAYTAGQAGIAAASSAATITSAHQQQESPGSMPHAQITDATTEKVKPKETGKTETVAATPTSTTSAAAFQPSSGHQSTQASTFAASASVHTAQTSSRAKLSAAPSSAATDMTPPSAPVGQALASDAHDASEAANQHM